MATPNIETLTLTALHGLVGKHRELLKSAKWHKTTGDDFFRAGKHREAAANHCLALDFTTMAAYVTANALELLDGDFQRYQELFDHAEVDQWRETVHRGVGEGDEGLPVG